MLCQNRGGKIIELFLFVWELDLIYTAIRLTI